MDLASHATTIGEILLDRLTDWVPEEVLAEATGLVGYAVRWYIYQLREAGFVIDAVMYTDREAFRRGARGWRLLDIRSTPYRPADHSAPEAPAEVPTAVRAAPGVRVEHPTHGRGVLTFALPGAAKVVASFKRAPRVELRREEVRAVVGSVLLALTD